jgi:hypothetical protein
VSVKLIAALAVVMLAAGARSPAHAQEPTPGAPVIFVEMTLAPARAAYVLAVRGAATDFGPYAVNAFVSAIGSDQGVVAEIARGDDDDLSITLDRPLDGMSGEGCYRVGFTVAADDPARQDAAADVYLNARACVRAGRLVFPSHDGVTEPPPAAPSDVRIVRVPAAGYPDAGGDTWRIDWTDNSDDEIAFDPGIILMDRPWGEGGTSLAGIEIPEVPADWTSAGSIGFFFTPDGPAQRTCGYALVLVFAVGGDDVSWPGSTTVPACFSAGSISFPSTGAGASKDHRLPFRFAALGSLGAALLAGGAVLRRRATSAAW